MTLTEAQLATVKAYFKQRLWQQERSYEELLDHFCCDVEAYMQRGLSFPQALHATQQCWNEEEVQKLNFSNQKSLTMMHLFSFVSVLLAFLTFSPMNGPAVAPLEPPQECPLQSEEFRETASFGEYWHPLKKRTHFHKGIDWQAPIGTPVHAAGNGVVVTAEAHDKYGLRIIIAHDETYETLYAHLGELHVKRGDTVTVGQWIGNVGVTGLTTAPHLHYEVLKNGQAIDPKQFLP
ncbi:MAG: M23 family metallopeptidase [Bacteroidota bacterium]